MLEILLIWFMTKKVGEIVEAKGYGSTLIRILFVGAYLFGAMMGGALGSIILGLRGRGDSAGDFLQIYVYAFIVALLISGFVFFIALILPEQKRERDFMDDYHDYRRTGRTRRYLDDEDDEPRYRRRSDDYHDDRDRDRPRRRRDDDHDDYDRRPRRRDYSDDRPRRRDDDRDRPRRRDDY